MRDKDFILNKLNGNEVKVYLESLNLNSFILLGSILTEDFNEESDVDIAILATEKLKMKDILKLERFFEDILIKLIEDMSEVIEHLKACEEALILEKDNKIAL